jgi:hypothetical protein
MSLPIENRSGQLNHQNFLTFMKENLGETYDALNTSGRELDRSTLTGFKGLMKEHEINMWNFLGFGKVLGIPITRGHMQEEVPINPADYRGVMYVMPYTERKPNGKGLDQRMLVVLPSEDTVEMAIIGPLPWGRESVAEFNRRFSPSETPYILSKWSPKHDESPLDTFMENQKALSAIVINKVEERNHIAVLDVATTLAHKIRKGTEKKAA